MTVTVAIPVRNGGARFVEVLRAVRDQQLDREVELLVADTASTDGSAEAARRHGAHVIAIPPEQFSHGGTRNLLADRASGDHIAFLTQDALPASSRWLAELLAGFELAADVGLVYGPYVPAPNASQPVARELRAWFAALAPDGGPRIDRLESGEAREEPWRLGPQRAFFTDANGCVAKAAWAKVRFRDVAYAEDQQLGLDMLRAGFAKAYVPSAAVVHSHDYGPSELLRRSFDESRGLHQVLGLVEPFTVSAFRGNVSSRVKADGRDLRAQGAPLVTGLVASLVHHLARWVGAILGSRSDRLPGALRRALSLEGRA